MFTYLIPKRCFPCMYWIKIRVFLCRKRIVFFERRIVNVLMRYLQFNPSAVGYGMHPSQHMYRGYGPSQQQQMAMWNRANSAWFDGGMSGREPRPYAPHMGCGPRCEHPHHMSPAMQYDSYYGGAVPRFVHPSSSAAAEQRMMHPYMMRNDPRFYHNMHAEGPRFRHPAMLHQHPIAGDPRMGYPPSAGNPAYQQAMSMANTASSLPGDGQFIDSAFSQSKLYKKKFSLSQTKF